ncbi:MAG: coproporphyrinogen dehydrogenase HemZ [Ruminococcaceae bacterium]|nr:coproporphyrinogen dehydrogenase HemZ [Oscillospiraceae bacterium]
MKLHVSGEINEYYVQTICMIFFPGEKFSGEEQEGAPVLYLDVSDTMDEITATARLLYQGKETSATKQIVLTGEFTKDRARKIVIGHAILSAAGEMMHYRPSWGMLTGVRPSKVATELLLSGMSKTKVRKALSSHYMVIPKKAALATDVAIREQQIIGNPDRGDCSVYISIPFCPTRCSYCSFVSYTSKRLLSLIPAYLELLCQEIRAKFAAIRALGLRVLTVYIGGGTPTILSAEQLRTLLSTVASCTDVSALREYTLESGRPDTIDSEKMAIAKAFGVTRVCVNPQTLCDEVLRGVGRCHSAQDFYRAYDIARQSGIDCINTDLIVGLPGDKFSSFAQTYDEILRLSPENITVHTFCVKKSAEILREGKRVYNLRGGDAGKCVDYSQIRAAEAGYQPYYMYRQKNMVGNFENVGFAKPGTECLYNIYMMEEVHSIFAAGAGAVTKLVDYAPAGSGKKSVIERLFNDKYPYEYLNADGGKAQAEQIVQFYRERGF